MGTRILLADDSVTIQKVVELTFMDEDYEVVAVSNGDEALAQLAALQPALVIADVHMPGANGYDVCRRVKEWRPGTPVLLLVGTFEPFQEDEAARAGSDGHLKKPFDSQELLRRVETLLANAGAPAAAAPAAPAEEMDLWAAPPAEPEQPATVFGGGAPAEEEPAPSFAPAGPIPDELVIERDPWTQAEEEPYAEAAPEAAEPAGPAGPPPPQAPAAAAMAMAPTAFAPAAGGDLSYGDVDRIARRVV